MASEDSHRFPGGPFLLIVRTRRIVTGPSTSSAGSSEIPAYSQILLRQRFHLRTVHVVAPSRGKGLGWIPALMVAHEIGLSHPSSSIWRVRRIVSEDSLHRVSPLPTVVHPLPEVQHLQVAGLLKRRSTEDLNG